MAMRWAINRGSFAEQRLTTLIFYIVMNKQETLKRVREVCRVRRLSIHTEQSYVGWIARFCEHENESGQGRKK